MYVLLLYLLDLPTTLFLHIFSCIYAYDVDKWDVELKVIQLINGFTECHFMCRFLKFQGTWKCMRMITWSKF